jgi:deoxyribodipyrimidine photo-lyase
LADAQNIERYTEGRHAPHGLLATEAPPIPADHPIPKPSPLLPRDIHIPGEKTLLLVTEEDLSPESWPIPTADVEGVILIETTRSQPDGPNDCSSLVSAFRSRSLESTRRRLETSGYPSVTLLSQTMETGWMKLRELLESRHFAGKPTVTMMGTTVGTTRKIIAPIVTQMKEEGIAVRSLRRDWDDALWPHATHGFFRFREQIPSVLRRFA